MTAPFDPVIDALAKALWQSVPMRAWLRTRRWCGETIGPRTEVSVKDRAGLASSADEAVAFFLVVAREPSGAQPLHVPLAISAAKLDPEAFELQVGADRWFVTEAERGDGFGRFLVDGFRDRLVVRTLNGEAVQFRGEPLGAFRSCEFFGEESSNLLLRIATDRGDVVFKSYKILDVGNREPLILERLNAKGFRHAARYRGELALGKGPDRLVLGVATEHVEAPDAFTWLTGEWRAEILGPAPSDVERTGHDLAGALGEATAALHEALLDRHPGPFQVATFVTEDSDAAQRAGVTNLSDSLRRLAALAKGPDARAADLAAKARAMVFENRNRIESALAGIDACVGTAKGVTHADLHLGQILRTAKGDLLFLDFEGEPERGPGERAAKLPFLRDVATMNRSFAYVKHYAWREATRGDATAAWELIHRHDWTEPQRETAARLEAWEAAAVERFSRRYLEASSAYTTMDAGDASRALRGWAMEKALYELRYELKHRPQNIFIPLEGVLSLAAAPAVD